MNFSFFYKLQNLWPFTLLKDADLRASDDLVRNLPVPGSTKSFVYAFRGRDSQSTVYILAVQGLSTQSATDVDSLIKAVRPQAVVAQVSRTGLLEVQSEVDELMTGDGEHSFPTSLYGVIAKCFLEKFTKERYDIVARNLILREIFGVGFHGNVLAAKKAAEEAGSSFLLLEVPFVNKASYSDDDAVDSTGSHVGPQTGSSAAAYGLLRGFSSDYVQAQMIKKLSHYLDVPKLKEGVTEVNSSAIPNDSKSTEDQSILPEFAEAIHSLFVDLHNVFIGIPLLTRALCCLKKLLVDVNRGEVVEKSIISDVYAFRIAIEGLRIALNDAGRLPISKSEKVDEKVLFSQLANDEKSYALLARALQSQGNKFKTIVAVVDANCVRGIRKHWNTSLPSEVEHLIELSVSAWDSEKELPNRLNWPFSGKPLVAVGAGATAVVGASSFTKVVPVSTLIKLVSLKIPTSLKLIFSQTYKVVSVALTKSVGPSKLVAPGLAKSGANSSFMKAISAQHIRSVAHSIITSAEKTSISAMRTAFYEIMRTRRAKPIGALPWATFGGSVATCSALLYYGDGIEYAAEALPAAASIACLGRGIHNLQQTSQEVAKAEANQIQQSIETLTYRFKRVNIQ